MNLWNNNWGKSINWSLQKLSQLQTINHTVLVHDDLLPYNCFYNTHNNSLIIFDPIPHGSLAILDISKTIFKLSIKYGDSVAENFLKGYDPFDTIPEEYISAGIILRGLMQVATWIKRGEVSKVVPGINFIQDTIAKIPYLA